MIRFFATSTTFLEDLRKLEKKKKNNYYNLRKDICKEFGGLEEINDVLKTGDVLSEVTEGDRWILRKIRIPNSVMREGKSGGFRLINFAMIQDDTVAFLSVFPKKENSAKQTSPKRNMSRSLQNS